METLAGMVKALVCIVALALVLAGEDLHAWIIGMTMIMTMILWQLDSLNVRR